MYEGRKCVVRCKGAGVFFATIKEFTPETGVAVLQDARRLWYWQGASECLQLAKEGVKTPQKCKFTITVHELCVTNVIEVTPCTDEAVKSLTEVSEWKSR